MGMGTGAEEEWESLLAAFQGAFALWSCVAAAEEEEVQLAKERRERLKKQQLKAGLGLDEGYGMDLGELGGRAGLPPTARMRPGHGGMDVDGVGGRDKRKRKVGGVSWGRLSCLGGEGRAVRGRGSASARCGSAGWPGSRGRRVRAEG